MNDRIRAVAGEFIGTYFLVFMGTGAIITDTLTKSLTHIGVSLVFGLVIMVEIYAFGHISGAHFNPAVTIAFLIVRDISLPDTALYIISQLAAAICASFTLRLLFGNVAQLGTTLPAHAMGQAFTLEFLLTFFLMIVILYSAFHKKANTSFAGIAIGGTIALEALFAGPITGASMNPARSIGPALVSGNVQYLWIYIFSTVAGAASAAGIYRFFYHGQTSAVSLKTPVRMEIINNIVGKHKQV